MLAHVEAGGVDFKRLEAQLLHPLGNLRAAVFDRLDLLDGHFILSCAELGPLIAQARAVFRAFRDQLLAKRQGFSVITAAVCRNF